MSTTLALLMAIQLSPEQTPEGDRLLTKGYELLRSGRAVEAETAFRDAVRILESAPRASLAAALNNLGTCLAERGELDRALPVLRRALSIAAETLEPQDRARIAGNTAYVYIQLRDLRSADPLLALAIRLSEDTGNPYAAYALSFRAEVFLTRRQWSRAHADLDRVMQMLATKHSYPAALAVSAHALRAAAWTGSGDPGSALTEYALAVALAARLPRDTINMRSLLKRYGDSLRQAKRSRRASKIECIATHGRNNL